MYECLIQQELSTASRSRLLIEGEEEESVPLENVFVSEKSKSHLFERRKLLLRLQGWLIR